jgi:hypothetical protein
MSGSNHDNEWYNFLCDTNPAVMITRLFGIVVLAFSIAEVPVRFSSSPSSYFIYLNRLLLEPLFTTFFLPYMLVHGGRGLEL